MRHIDLLRYFLLTAVAIGLLVCRSAPVWAQATHLYESTGTIISRWDIQSDRTISNRLQLVDVVQAAKSPNVLEFGAGYLWWGQNDGDIYRSSPSGQCIELFYNGAIAIGALELVLSESKVYWLERAATSFIRRADLDGSNVETVLTITGFAEHLTIDPGTSTFYFAIGDKYYKQTALDAAPTLLVDAGDEANDLYVEAGGSFVFGVGECCDEDPVIRRFDKNDGSGLTTLTVRFNLNSNPGELERDEESGYFFLANGNVMEVLTPSGGYEKNTITWQAHRGLALGYAGGPTLPIQVGTPGPPSIVDTEFATGAATHSAAASVDACSSETPAQRAANAPGYLRTTHADGLGLSPVPTATNTLRIPFNLGASVPKVCVDFRRYGSESNSISLYRDAKPLSGSPQAQIFSYTVAGNGESVALDYQVDHNSALAAGSYFLEIDYLGSGADNGFYIDALAIYGSDCGVLSSTAEGASVNGMTRFNREQVFLIGRPEDYVEGEESKLGDEFLQNGIHYSQFRYEVETDPDNELLSPQLPGVISQSGTGGAASAAELNLPFTLPRDYSRGLKFSIEWFSDSNAAVDVLYDGAFVYRVDSSRDGTANLSNILLKDATEGAHTITLRAVAGALALDHLRLQDQESDLDGDGLSDPVELAYGTDAALADTDGDSLDDWYEIATGSDPNDKRSGYILEGNRIPRGWNSNIGIVNIEEVRNRSDAPRSITASLYDNLGVRTDIRGFNIPARGQFDILVGLLDGYRVNSIGSTVVEHAASKGELQAQMVYYRPSESRSRNYDFAFANWTPAVDGVQVVPFNTFYPNFQGANPSGQSWNWIELTHIPHSDQAAAARSVHTGLLELFGMSGEDLGTYIVQVLSGARYDIGVHDLVGPGVVGFMKWTPQDSEKYSLKNSRYYYDAARAAFLTAYQLAAQQGSLQWQYLPLELDGKIAVLELTNASEKNNQVDLELRTKEGRAAANLQFILPPHSSRHLIANEYPLLVAAGLGSARVRGTELLSVVSMQYVTGAAAEPHSVSGVPGKEAVAEFEGSAYTLGSSHNTYLGQSCDLLVMNTHSQRVAVEAVLYGGDGSELHKETLYINGRGALRWPACNVLPANQYGPLELRLDTAKQPGATPPVAWLYRNGNLYRFPTAVY